MPRGCINPRERNAPPREGAFSVGSGRPRGNIVHYICRLKFGKRSFSYFLISININTYGKQASGQIFGNVRYLRRRYTLGRHPRCSRFILSCRRLRLDGRRNFVLADCFDSRRSFSPNQRTGIDGGFMKEQQPRVAARRVVFDLKKHLR